MEENLHSINAMKSMEVINIVTGEKIGFVRDIKIDSVEQRILSIIIPGESRGWFAKSEDLEIPWGNITKVGIDVILVQLEEMNFQDIYE